jgi:hypothetical protein
LIPGTKCGTMQAVCVPSSGFMKEPGPTFIISDCENQLERG